MPGLLLSKLSRAKFSSPRVICKWPACVKELVRDSCYSSVVVADCVQTLAGNFVLVFEISSFEISLELCIGDGILFYISLFLFACGAVVCLPGRVLVVQKFMFVGQ